MRGARLGALLADNKIGFRMPGHGKMGTGAEILKD